MCAVNLMAYWTPEKVKELRQRLGMTQPTFAEALGVSRQMVSKWESGVDSPGRQKSLDALRELDGAVGAWAR